MPVLTEERRSGVVPPAGQPPGGGDDGRADDSGPSFPISKGQIGVWILLTAITMLFAGLTSAYIVLRGVPTWQNIELPSLLWPNTFVLLMSSVALEFAKRAIRKNHVETTTRWLAVSAVLGLVFLAGQLAAWRQLVAAGVYLPSTLQSSFFYILTGLHGLHLVGGIGAMGFVFNRAVKKRLTAFNHEPLKLCAMYWHVMDALWIYLFLLLLLS